MAGLSNGNTFRFLDIHAELPPIAKDPEQHRSIDVSESAYESQVIEIHFKVHTWRP